MSGHFSGIFLPSCAFSFSLLLCIIYFLILKFNLNIFQTVSINEMLMNVTNTVPSSAERHHATLGGTSGSMQP